MLCVWSGMEGSLAEEVEDLVEEGLGVGPGQQQQWRMDQVSQ